MLKIIKNTRSAAKLKKSKIRVDSSEITNQISSIKRKNQPKTTKFKILIKFKNHDFSSNSENMKAEPGFFISKARLSFIKLK